MNIYNYNIYIFQFYLILIYMEYIEHIKKIVDTNLIYVYRNGKVILTGKTLKDIRKNIKEKFDNPSKGVKIYLIRFSINKELEDIFSISCTQMTITPLLSLDLEEDDETQTILYTKKNLDKTPFTLSHIKYIIKALRDNLISTKFTDDIYISDIFNKLKQQKRITKN
jgi:hypothetical protein